MSKSRMLMLLGVVLVVLLAVTLLLVRKESIVSKLVIDKLPISNSLQESISPRYSNRKENPVKKLILGDNERVLWEIRAEVVQPFRVDHNLLQGTIRVWNDKNRVEIPCQLGYLDNNIVLGRFSNGIDGSDVTWKIEDQAEVLPYLSKSGAPLRVRVSWQKSAGGLEELRKLEAVWDAVLLSFSEGAVSVPATLGGGLVYGYEVGVEQ